MKLFSEKNVSKTHLAFTLIDVIVGMGVLGVVLLSLFASFSFGFNVVKSSREDLQATQILHEKLEAVRVYTWQQLNEPNFIPTKFQESMGDSAKVFFTGTVLVTNVNLSESYSTNLKQIIVTISWTNNNSVRSRTNTTYVSKNGMQKYILQ